ncbi:MAG: asparagine--tRNA ligase [Candidatus Shikimatogenerans sp. JK-2022]|nr:asparagine--tRNA ligase [Candidatus Shikimatogenerans bostrichidophilus]
MYKYYSINKIYKKKNKFINKNIIIKGWVKYFRNNLFLDINDGTTVKNIQIVIKKKKFIKIKKKICIGYPLKILGKLIKNKNNKNLFEVIPKNIKLYGKIDKFFINNSILQNKFHNLSKLRENEQIYLRFRTNIFNLIMKIRHNLFFIIHKYFNKKNFIYINTPIINKNNVEGSCEVFKITTLDLFKKQLDCNNDLFKCKANLTVSGQLEIESAMYGLGNVYTFGPVFRAENSNTNKHLSEFWMLEPEIIFFKLKNIIKFVIKFIKYIFKKILKKSKNELLLLENYHKKNNKKKNIINRIKNIINKKFYIISYNKIIKLLNKYKKNIINWGDEIKSIHENILFNKIIKNNIPIIIYNFPIKIKPFYMKLNKNIKTTKSFDIIFPFIGEIIGGSERETNYKKLLKIIKKKKMNIKDIIWYLNLRKLGKIYHSGFGLGFDRLIQYITGMNNIRDVIPFPIYPKYKF